MELTVNFWLDRVSRLRQVGEEPAAKKTYDLVVPHDQNTGAGIASL